MHVVPNESKRNVKNVCLIASRVTEMNVLLRLVNFGKEFL